MAREMIVALNIIFTLIVLMIVRTVWLLIKEKKRIKGVKSYFKSPMTMSIGERIKRERRHLRW